MFGKRKCNSCMEKINEKYIFCPYCGNSPAKRPKENYGMLGEGDFMNEFENFSNSIFGGIGGKVIGKMFKNAVKILEKEMEKEANTKRRIPRTNFQLFINGQRVDSDGHLTYKRTKQKKEIRKLPQNTLKKFSNLPKKETKTNVRRFSDKIVYEINMPGVKSLKDISITKLEDNVEVKAVSKDKAYQKMIPVNFPITDYNLSKGKLVLEFSVSE